MIQFRFLPLLAGAIAAVILAVTPLAAFAQTQAPQQEQAPPRIVLSAEQETKFAEIQAATITKIEDVLTPAQKTQFAAALENGEGLNSIENLSPQQISDIQAILIAFNNQIGELLTAEQMQQIEQSQSQQ